jgi:hypothetical protein
MVMAGVLGYILVIRPWHLRWGATDFETQQPLSGDELVAQPKLQATHAVTIGAPAAEVWPWILQLGQGRGGFYSYDWLENLFGLDIHSAHGIIPEFQTLKVGDLIRISPRLGLPVASVEPGRSLVLFGRLDTRTGLSAAPSEALPQAYFASSWVFVLTEPDPETTRLIVRTRTDWNHNFLNNLIYLGFLEPASFLMERKMLLGIKERAEDRGGRPRGR